MYDRRWLRCENARDSPPCSVKAQTATLISALCGTMESGLGGHFDLTITSLYVLSPYALHLHIAGA